MGLSIGYSGKLDDPSRLDEAVSQVQSFCKEIGWKHREYSEQVSGVLIGAFDERGKPSDEPWPEPRKGEEPFRFRVLKSRPPRLIEETHRGIYAIPPGAESVRLVFNPQGKLCNYTDIPSDMVLNAVRGETHYFGFPLFAKTGEAESHIGICALFKMLSKFIGNLKVEDDSGFWNTWDVKKLGESHQAMSALIGAMSRPGNLNKALKAAGLAPLSAGAKIETNVALPEKPKSKAAKVSRPS